MRTTTGILAAAGALALAGCGGGEGGASSGLRSMAQREASCATAADCCVVVDGCTATAYVVVPEDFEGAAALADAPRDACVNCETPVVELRCEAGACVGLAITDVESPAYDANRGDHCGDASGETTQALWSDGDGDAPAGRVLGCGA